MTDFPATVKVDAKPHYLNWHYAGDLLLWGSGFAGILLTQTGPLPGVSPAVWKWILVLCGGLALAGKMIQSKNGATTAATP